MFGTTPQLLPFNSIPVFGAAPVHNEHNSSTIVAYLYHPMNIKRVYIYPYATHTCQ